MTNGIGLPAKEPETISPGQLETAFADVTVSLLRQADAHAILSVSAPDHSDRVNHRIIANALNTEHIRWIEGNRKLLDAELRHAIRSVPEMLE